MTGHAKAILKDGLLYKSGETRLQAPRGEYDVDCRGDCVDLCRCSGENAFTLSYDAFLQHVMEGRIAIVGQPA